MTTDITAVVRQAWLAAIETERCVSLSRVAEGIFASHERLMWEHSEYLCRSAIMRILKRLAREQAEDEDAQLSLFGFPSVIAVPVASGDAEDSYYYVKTGKATWPELEAGRNVRVENILRAQVKLDQYDEALREIRPLMEGTDKTLGDVRAEMAGQAAA